MARGRGFRRWSYNGLRIPESEKIVFTTESAWKARHRRTRSPIADQVITIKCLEKFHKIRMTFPGRITLLDHPDRRGEETMLKLGGNKPECLTFLELWKQSPNECAYSRKGVQRFLDARSNWKAAKTSNRNAYVDWLQFKIADRLRARLEFIYQGLRSKISKGYECEDKEEHSYSYSWRNRTYATYHQEDQLVKPTVHLSFREVLSTPNKEDTDDESNL